VGYQQLGSV